MIGNITKGNGFYGCVAYVLGKTGAQLINTNMAGGTPAQLAWEFRTIANFNHRVQKPVLHLSFSPAPGDRTLDEWELCQIAQDLLDGLKLSNNQFILVTHDDAKYNGEPRPHAHMVINRVSYDGKCNDDYLDYYRTEKVLRQVEKNYDLIIQPSSWFVLRKKPYPKQIKQEQQTETPNTIQQLQTAILTAADDKPAMLVFVARLLKDGIKADVKYTRTGKVKGISYGIGEEHFAGNDLGKVFTFNGLQKHLGVSYDHSRDKPVIESLQESFTRGRVIDDARVNYLQDWLWWREKEETSTDTGDDFQQLTAPAVPSVQRAIRLKPLQRIATAAVSTGALSPTHTLEPKQTQPQSPTTPIPAVPMTPPVVYVQVARAEDDSVASPSIKDKLKLSINAAAADYPSMPELVAKLYLTGVKVKVESSIHGLATGISYEIDGISINSSNLGEQYNFEGLQNLGVDYNPEWDNRLIETIVHYGLEGRKIDDSYIDRLRHYRQTKQFEAQRMEQVFQVLGIEVEEGLPVAKALDSDKPNEKAVKSADSWLSVKAPPNNDVAITISATITDENGIQAVGNTIPVKSDINNDSDDSVTGDGTSEKDAANENDFDPFANKAIAPLASISQEYTDKTGATIRQLWQRQGQPNQINGQHYDLELTRETLQVMRKSGEQIASVPLDSSITASFQGFTQEDWDRFDLIEAMMRAEHLRKARVREDSLEQTLQQRQQRHQGGIELD